MTKEQLRVGVCIPDRGDRPLFLERCLSMMDSQTRKPDFIRVVSEDVPATKNGIDITRRYAIGFKELFLHNGCDVVFCIESDDWYSDKYISTMLKAWENNGKPQVFGLEYSIYYNIVSCRYSKFKHKKRSSMMSTMVTSAVLDHKFDFENQYLDFKLWTDRKFTRKTFVNRGNPIAIGIKHGHGLVGGTGHDKDWDRFEKVDKGYSELAQTVGDKISFYMIMGKLDNYEVTSRSNSDSPFLTIVTRKHGERRPQGLSRNVRSINALKGDWQQIFIKDKKGLGMHYANMSFVLSVPEIKGEWVYLLDDDDNLVNPEMVNELKAVAESENPEVIVFRMTIKNGAFGNHYPSPQCWKEKMPIMAHIGGSCFALRKDVFIKYIPYFGRPRCGDYYMLEEIWKSSPKVSWIDKLMSETGGNPSHGKTEI